MAIRTIKNRLILLAAVGALQACIPIQQAPLVYSSKVTVGLDVTTPTTEQPAAAINIGFKMLDLAYVPVAVAKPCDKNSPIPSDCTNNIYQLKRIVGSSNESEQSGDNPDGTSAGEATAATGDKSKSPDADDSNNEQMAADEPSTGYRASTTAITLKALSEHIRQLSVAKASKEKEAQKAEELAKEKSEAAKSKVASAPNSKAATAATLEALEASKLASSTKAEVAAIDNTIANKKIQKALISQNNIKAKDAYSVFGSFDSGTKTEANGTEATAKVDLKLGKVFSTGVAAQYLTRGLGKQFANNAASTCLASANSMIDTYLKTVGTPTDAPTKTAYSEFAKTALEICGQPANGS